MLATARIAVRPPALSFDQRTAPLIAHLRNVVLAPPALHERCHAIFVDADRACLGEAAVGMGGADTLQLRMRSLFGEALRMNAAGMILAHNHPSGQCRPSSGDITATRRLQEIGRALDIALIDHLIFTTEAIYSMRAGGLL